MLKTTRTLMTTILTYWDSRIILSYILNIIIKPGGQTHIGGLILLLEHYKHDYPGPLQYKQI